MKIIPMIASNAPSEGLSCKVGLQEITRSASLGRILPKVRVAWHYGRCGRGRESARLTATATHSVSAVAMRMADGRHCRK